MTPMSPCIPASALQTGPVHDGATGAMLRGWSRFVRLRQARHRCFGGPAKVQPADSGIAPPATPKEKS